MEEKEYQPFFAHWYNKKTHFPLSGQLELSHRCSLDCIHCFCKGSEDNKRELTTSEWKKILAMLQKEGTVWLTFTGGDPLIRNDFLQIYSFAKAKGFIAVILTNGQLLNQEIIQYLVKSPPYSIEITLNGITQKTYESVTQVKGSFLKAMQNIRILAKNKLPIVLKTNFLKQNQEEIIKIKKFTEGLLGKPSGNRHFFRYDPMIYPRRNQDQTPTAFRLSFSEILSVQKQDPDIWAEYLQELSEDYPDKERPQEFLYRCTAWRQNFFIDPYGRLKFCELSDKFSVDLKRVSFKEGFYKIFPRLWRQKFKTCSRCKTCKLRQCCYHCPGRAYLETGDEEAPVEYYCQLALHTAKQMRLAKKNLRNAQSGLP